MAKHIQNFKALTWKRNGKNIIIMLLQTLIMVMTIKLINMSVQRLLTVLKIKTHPFVV